jgi:hypothetical protein
MKESESITHFSKNEFKTPPSDSRFSKKKIEAVGLFGGKGYLFFKTKIITPTLLNSSPSLPFLLPLSVYLLQAFRRSLLRFLGTFSRKFSFPLLNLLNLQKPFSLIAWLEPNLGLGRAN